MGVRLHVRASGQDDEELVYEFDQHRIVIGRGRGADVCLPHASVSTRHATIELTERGYAVVDHESLNGTRVGGVPIVPGRPKALRDGDALGIGRFRLIFRSGVPVTAPTSSERTASLARALARAARSPDDDPERLRPVITIVNGPRRGTRIVLPPPPARLLVGREEHCDIWLPDADASREHVALIVSLEGVTASDLDSKNGMFVGGRPVRERLLGDSDEIRIGATVLLFEDPAEARVRELEAVDDEPHEPEPEPQPLDPEEIAPAEDEPEPPSPPNSKAATIAPADVLIYVLSAAIFAVSVLGLAWLLRG